MKRKIFVGILIITIYTIVTFGICYAENETQNLTMTGSIDEEKNITLNVQASDINGFEGTISFDSDIVEYVGVEEKNGSKVKVNSETLDISTLIGEALDSEVKEIATIKFKVKDSENIIDTGIYITNVKILKKDNSMQDFQDFGVLVKVNEETATVEQDDSDEETSDLAEGEATDENGNALSEENLQEASAPLEYEIEYENADEEGSSENNVEEKSAEADDSVEDTNKNEGTNKSEEATSTTVEAGDSVEDTNKNEGTNKSVEPTSTTTEEVLEDEKNTDKKDKSLVDSIKDNLANGKLPQTGIKLSIIPLIFMLIFSVIASISYKKSLGKKK